MVTLRVTAEKTRNELSGSEDSFCHFVSVITSLILNKFSESVLKLLMVGDLGELRKNTERSGSSREVARTSTDSRDEILTVNFFPKTRVHIQWTSSSMKRFATKV